MVFGTTFLSDCENSDTKKTAPKGGPRHTVWALAIVTLLATVPALLHPVDEGA